MLVDNAKIMIMKLVEQRFNALKNKDANKLDSLLANDFIYTNALGDTLNKEDYIKKYGMDESVSWFSQMLEVMHIIIRRKYIIISAKVHDHALFGEYELKNTYFTTQVYEKIKFSWKYLIGHTSNTVK